MQTNTITAPTRRSAPRLSVTAFAAGLTTPPLAIVNPDAELIDLCAAFHRQHAIAVATDDQDDDGLESALAVRWGISDQIEQITAVTDAGMKAKAKLAVFLLEENRGPDAGDESGDLHFAYAALLDVAGSVRVMQRRAVRAAPDPVLKIYRRYLALEAQQEAESDRGDAIREGLLERCGGPSKGRCAPDIWRQDPAFAELLISNDECDVLSEKILAVTEKLNDTPARTIRGVIAKLQLTLDVWPGCTGGAVHEDSAISAVRDAMRVLQGTVA
jgi:hypothetical protein